MNRRTVPGFVALINGLLLGLLLASIFYTWRFAYFWLDDFNVFYWTQRLDRTLGEMLWDCVNPFASAFRPVGMLVYWIFWHAFDLNPMPYHIFAWTLHTLNVILLYALLSRITGSFYGAAVGALLFGFRANFAEIYWSFGAIFELVALLLMLIALLIYTSGMKSNWKLISTALLYLLAVKSKEMAITLPALLLLYDICFSRLTRKLAGLYAVLGLFGLAFAYTKVATMGGAARTDAYFMDVSVLTLGRGYGWYFDRLYGLRLRWGAWTIMGVLLLAWLVYRRSKPGLFFLGYLVIALSPVVFLVNHRFETYWYIPFVGISGLAAVTISAIENRMRVLMPAKALAATGLAAFALLAIGHYQRERRASAELIQNQRSLAAEYEKFVAALQNLPPPEPEATIYFRSLPRHFDTDVLTSATQVALHRTDVTAKVVQAFPDPCRSCVDAN